MGQAKKIASAAVYASGATAVALLLLLTATGAECVLFPDAMLPMDLREVASAWMAIGFLPMLLASVLTYNSWDVKRSGHPRRNRLLLFLPAAVCLAAMLFWVGVWAAGMPRSSVDAGGDIVLPEPEKIEAVRFTGSELDLTFGGDVFISKLLDLMSRAKETGRESVQDIPDQSMDAIRIDLYFKRLAGKGRGGTSTVFLYRDGEDLLLEQPYQGIYRADSALEQWLRRQIAEELAQGVKMAVFVNL